MDLWLVLRIVCLIGCLASLYLLSTSRFRQWAEWTPKTKDHWWALTGWTFVGVYGIIEQLAQKNEGGSRLIVLTLVVLLTLRALLRSGELKAHAVVTREKD